MRRLHRSLIQSLPAFSGMDEAELDDVIARATILRIPRGRPVFEQGQTATAFYVLLEGCLKVVQATPKGRQVLIHFILPGDIYGIAKAFNRTDYPATTTAIVDSVTLAWDMGVWDDFTECYPTFVLNVMNVMGQWLQDAHVRLMEMAAQDVERRVAYAMLRLVRSGCRVGEGILVDFPITPRDIAEASGTTLRWVSRVLNAWENTGLVATGRRKVMVCKPDGLSLIAEQTRCGHRKDRH